MLFLPQRESRAQFAVFDASNLASNIMQVTHAVTQITNQAQQIQHQIQMLKNIDLDSLAEVEQAMGAVQDMIRTSERIRYEASSIDDRFKDMFPDQWEGVTREQIEELRGQWAEQNRHAVLESMRAQDTVVESMPDTTDRIRQVLGASNSASGQKAATQANTQMLGTISTQLQELQAIHIAAQRAEATRQAERDAIMEYYRERRRQLHSDDHIDPNGRPIADPFPHAK